MESTTTKPARLLSLNVLRGLTVAFMILVNNAGDGAASYAQLRHSVWNGCTLTDVVFPLFLFMVGVSIVLSFTGRLARGASRASIAAQVLRRALLIIVLGLLINALPYFQLGTLRYFGVLQRIALCYALGSLIFLFGGIRACALAAVAALIGYWLLLTHLRVPGFGMPGIDLPPLDPRGNLTAWIDRSLVPPAHLYHHTFYDPEGLLSTIPSLANTLFGSLAAWWMLRARTLKSRGLPLLLVGTTFILTSLAWSHTFPFNKRLWTSSFALLTSGIGLVLLAVLHLWLDSPAQSPAPKAPSTRTTHPRSSALVYPAVVFGTNALAAYMLSEVLAIALQAIPAGGSLNLQQRLYSLLPHSLGPPPLISLLYSILFVAVCFLPIWALYRRRIFLKL